MLIILAINSIKASLAAPSECGAVNLIFNDWSKIPDMADTIIPGFTQTIALMDQPVAPCLIQCKPSIQATSFSLSAENFTSGVRLLARSRSKLWRRPLRFCRTSWAT